MEMILRASRHLVVVGVLGCLVMFAMLMVYAAVAVGSVLVKMMGSGFALSEIAVVTVYAFKILDLFLLATILYIVALGWARSSWRPTARCRLGSRCATCRT